MSTVASVVLKLIDKTSEGFSSVNRAAQTTGKTFDELSGKVAALKSKNASLDNSYVDLQTKIVDARKAVQEATKAYKDSGDEISRTNLKEAEKQYKTLTDQLGNFRTASADTRREIRELENEMRRLGSEGGGGAGGDSGEGAGGALSGWSLAISGLGKQFGSAAGALGTAYLNSALGSTDAGLLTSAITGALTGAATGAVAGPWGAAVGAVVGAAAGRVEGAAAQYEAEDEAFKSYRDELISNVTEKSADALSAGIQTAATREQDKIGFGALLGSQEDAEGLLSAIRDLSNVTPYVYDDLTGIARQLAIFDSTSEDLYGNLVKIGDAGAALSMSTSDMAGLAQLLGKIGDSETYQSTYTRSLRNYGLNPASIFAEYFGVTQAEANTMMTKGKISGEDAMNAILTVLDRRYGGMMEAQSHTYAGALSTREGLEAERNAFLGTAYNEARVAGLEAHNEWLGQFVGSEALSVIGTANAQKDNLEDAIYRDVFSGIFEGQETSFEYDEETQQKLDKLREDYVKAVDEYSTADAQRQMEIGAHISSIYDQAQALATAAADVSPLLDAWDQAAIDTAKGVGEIVSILNAHADSWAYSKVIETGQGAYTLQGGAVGNATQGEVSDFAADVEAFGAFSARRAEGQRVIPYDGFPIIAHQGEMLLTASEARAYNNQTSSVTISGNTFVVRQESDIDAIADALVAKLRLAQQVIA